MTANQFGDLKIAADVEKAVRNIAKSEINKQRPVTRLAQVVSVDEINRRVEVTFVGETTPVTVPYVGSGTIPSNTGQWVRVGGTTNNRYIEDVVGTTKDGKTLEGTVQSVGELQDTTQGLADVQTFLQDLSNAFLSALGGNFGPLAALIGGLVEIPTWLSGATGWSAEVFENLAGFFDIASQLLDAAIQAFGGNFGPLISLIGSLNSGGAPEWLNISGWTAGVFATIADIVANVLAAFKALAQLLDGVPFVNDVVDDIVELIASAVNAANISVSQVQGTVAELEANLPNYVPGDGSNTGDESITLFSTLFQGINNDPLPTPWLGKFNGSASNKICIRDNKMGLNSTISNNDRPYASSTTPADTDDHSITVVLADDGDDTEPTYLVIGSDIDCTTGAIATLKRGSASIGYFTRSGTTWNITNWGPASVAPARNAKVEWRRTGETFKLLSNNQPIAQKTDDDNLLVPIGPTKRHQHVAMKTGLEFFSQRVDSFKISKAIVTDIIPAAAGSTYDAAWSVRRGTSSNSGTISWSTTPTALPTTTFDTDDFTEVNVQLVDRSGLYKILKSGFYIIQAGVISTTPVTDGRVYLYTGPSTGSLSQLKSGLQLGDITGGSVTGSTGSATAGGDSHSHPNGSLSTNPSLRGYQFDGIWLVQLVQDTYIQPRVGRTSGSASYDTNGGYFAGIRIGAGLTGDKGFKGDTGDKGDKGDPSVAVLWQGTVANAAALPGSYTTADAGKGWVANDNKHAHVWLGAAWVDLGTIVGPTGGPGADAPTTDGMSLYQTLTTRAVGVGQLGMGFELPYPFRITSIKYAGSTADSAGSSVAELRKNGTAGGNTLSGTSFNVDISSITNHSGLSIDLVAGDIIYPYITSLGSATPGQGFVARIKGNRLG